MTQWANCCEPATAHVVPMGDLREHDCSVSCWCKPTEDDEVAGLFVHHSMDGREQFEAGERMPS
jgi:hypothetical protein